MLRRSTFNRECVAAATGDHNSIYGDKQLTHTKPCAVGVLSEPISGLLTTCMRMYRPILTVLLCLVTTCAILTADAGLSPAIGADESEAETTAAPDKPRKEAKQGVSAEVPAKPDTIDRPDLENDPELYFLMAEQALADKDYDSAIAYYRKALELDPESAVAVARLGELLLRRNKLGDALIMARHARLLDPDYDMAGGLAWKIEKLLVVIERIFQTYGPEAPALSTAKSVLEGTPDSGPLLEELGRLQASLGLYGEAVETFNRMIDKYPQAIKAYVYIGRVYAESGQYDEAIAAFEKLLNRGPGIAAQAQVELGRVYMLKKELDEAEKHFRQAVKIDPTDTRALTFLAQLLLTEKKYDEAYKVFEQLSELLPSDMRIKIRMALILSARKQYDKAENLLNEILEKRPGVSQQIRYQLGRIYREQGRTEEAEKEFLKIQKGSPDYLRSRIVMALMFLRSRDYAKALMYAGQAIEEDPMDADLYHLRGSILEELVRYQEAIDNYKKALATAPENTRIRYSLGNVYEKSGRRSKSLEAMERILEEEPEDAGAANFIGYTLLMMGKDIERAEELITQAHDRKPDDGYIMDSVAWMLYKQGKTEEALEKLKAAVEKVPADPIIFDHLGDVLVKLDRKKEALDAYEKSLEANPHNVIVQEKKNRLEQELKKSND